jgi:hypothetical protein
MDEIPARSLPLRFILILLICLGSLIVHFFADAFGPAGQSFATEWIDHGENDGSIHEIGEDIFVFPEFIGLENPQASVRIACEEYLGFSSFAHLPLLPPPITG